ncbi:MAG: 4Fe-4S dicluster domain-containing protein [Candidatus Sumerlaeia bacterium]
MNNSKILFCGCAFYQLVPEASRGKVLAALRQSGRDLIYVPDLCKYASEKNALMEELSDAEELQVVACYPRAIRWLFHAAGYPLDMDRVRVYNMREQSPEEILAGLLGEAPDLDSIEAEAIKPEGEWTPWFPVIDYERCVDCKQCHNFCLFGTYDLDEDEKVRVVEPSACKTDCPACARICPEAAIIFPKYGNSPINGDEIRDEVQEKERIKVDVEKIMGGDIYTALAKRRKQKRKMRLLKKDVQ